MNTKYPLGTSKTVIQQRIAEIQRELDAIDLFIQHNRAMDTRQANKVSNICRLQTVLTRLCSASVLRRLAEDEVKDMGRWTKRAIYTLEDKYKAYQYACKRISDMEKLERMIEQ